MVFNEGTPIDRRLILIEDRQTRLEANHDKLADSLVFLRQDVIESERRLTDKVDMHLTKIRDAIQIETSQIDQHLSNQDAHILNISQAVLESRNTWPLSARVILLAILIPLLIGIVSALALHFAG